MSSSSCLRGESAACRDCLSSTTVTMTEPTRLTNAVRIPAVTRTDLPARAPSAAVSSSPVAATVKVRESTLIFNGPVCSAQRLNVPESSSVSGPGAILSADPFGSS